MIYFPPAKINLGLNVLDKRKDNYHNIETVMITIPLHDILEISESEVYEITYSGLYESIDEEYVNEMNIWLNQHNWLPKFKIHLHKIIPMRSGLGGGSSDLAFFVKHSLQYPLDQEVKKKIYEKAMSLSTDYHFFFNSTKAFVGGRGDEISEISIDVSGLHLLLLFPNLDVSTQKAYSIVKSYPSIQNNWNVFKGEMDLWKHNLSNDFENAFSEYYPTFKDVKHKLYSNGAIFASLSGSGSTIYGLFRERKNLENIFPDLKSRWIML